MLMKANECFIPESLLPQGSPEWLEWRSKGVGASDVFHLCYNSEDLGIKKTKAIAEFLGDKPKFCKTIAELAKVKSGDIVEDLSNNPHIKRGHRLEPIIRGYMESVTQVKLEPVCVVDPHNPHRRVSLDAYGLDEAGVAVVGEIKAPSNVDKWFGSDGGNNGENIPRMYVCQGVYQGAVVKSALGIEMIRQGYGIGAEGPDGVECDLFPMPKLPRGFEAFVVKCVDAFWAMYTAGTDMSGENDELDITQTDDGAAWAEAAQKYREHKIKIKQSEEALIEVEAALKNLAESTKRRFVSGNGVRWQKYSRKGNVDYSKLLAAHNIDSSEAEKYRKASSDVQKLELVD